MAIAEIAEAALIELVRSVAKTEIMPRFRRLDADAIAAKTGPEDLVTEADLRAEKAIAAGVRDILPEALVIGEEAVEADPDLVLGLDAAPLSVIIDPVDGTWNFAKGLATFGVILAVAEYGETVFGLLYDPVLDDWIYARRGGGTWYMSSDGAERRLNFGDGDGADLTGFVPIFMFPLSARTALAGELDGVQRIWSVRCSCHEYRTLLTGGADFGVSGALKPWDHAAGALACVEAGGAVGLLDGGAYRASTTGEGTLLSARSDAVLDQVRRTLSRAIDGAV